LPVPCPPTNPKKKGFLFLAFDDIQKQEGIIPAPEGNHAIKGAIDAALECKEKGESKTILFNLCGHGYFDMSAYDDYLNGSMADDVIDDDGIGKSISQIPEVA